MANSDIGYISKEDFMKLLPDKVPVRKSGKESARFPLYCHAPRLGPVPINTRAGQEIILECAVLYTPENPEPVPENLPEVVDPVPVEVVPEVVETDSESGSGFKSFLTELGRIDD